MLFNNKPNKHVSSEEAFEVCCTSISLPKLYLIQNSKIKMQHDFWDISPIQSYHTMISNSFYLVFIIWNHFGCL